MPYKFFPLLLLFYLPLMGWTINPDNLHANFSQIDKQLAKALDLIDEHPQKSLRISESSLLLAKNENSLYKTMLIYYILTRVNQNLGFSEIAFQYADSAEINALSLNAVEMFSHITKTKVDLFLQYGKEREALNLVSESLKKAKKMNNNQLIVESLLLQAHLHEQQNRLEEYIQTIGKAIEIAEKVNNKELMAECYHRMGSMFFRSSQFNEAIEWYSKAKQIRDEISDTLGVISILKNISLVNRDLGKLNESNALLNEAQQLAYNLGNKKQMADIYNLLGSLALRAKKSTEALEYYNQSLIIREKEGYLASVASTLENISRVQKDLNLFDDATSNLHRSIDIRIELNDSRGLASAYNDLGNLLSEKGDLAEALKYYLSALKIRQENNLQAEIARSLTNIGLTYRKLGSQKNAIKYFDQALEMISDKQDPIGKAYVFIHQGNTLIDMGNPSKALESFKQAFELRKITNNPITISQTYRSLANAYSDLNSYTQARNYLNKAHDLMDGIGDEIGVADILNELGNLALKENDYDEALLRFQHAALLYGKHFQLDKRGLCLRKIGEIQTKLGHYTIALENLKLAHSLGERTENEKLVELTLLALHNFHLARGEYREALDYFHQHILMKEMLGSKHHQESIWQASLDLELDKKVEEIKKIENEVESLRTEAKLKSIELKQQTLMRNFFATVSILVLILALGSVYGYVVIRQKNKWLNEANEKLSQSEENLKKMVQTKDKLFSIIAHDLRSPFTALVGLTEVFSHNASQLETKDISDYGSLIHQSSQKLLTLIENLLDWSRSQTGKIKLEPLRISLDKLTNEIINIHSLQANTKSITLKNTIPNDIVVYADYEMLSAVLRNLVSNAIKFTQENGSVELKAHRNDNNIIIKIIDNGVGISPENLKKLFKLEESFSTQGTDQESGTGLGLIVCKEFIEKNGGKISVESEVNEGTTFTISLPAS
jgi:signal transduction histidine kinase